MSTIKKKEESDSLAHYPVPLLGFSTGSAAEQSKLVDNLLDSLKALCLRVAVIKQTHNEIT